jgi:small subunit ribosomal protein S20
VEDLPNIKSAIKRVKITEKKSAANQALKSALKTSIKKCKEAIANEDTNLSDNLKATVKSIDKAAAKGLIHKNTASRRKSKLAKAANTK